MICDIIISYLLPFATLSLAQHIRIGACQFENASTQQLCLAFIWLNYKLQIQYTYRLVYEIYYILAVTQT